MNKVYIIGRLTADPTQTMINNVSCTNFSVASDTRNKDGDGNVLTNFYRISAWRGLGDTCAKYLHKGDRVCVIGDLLFRTYRDKNGQERAAMQVTMSDVEFLSSSQRGENAASAKAHTEGTTTTATQRSTTSQTAEGNNNDAQEDELPF